MLTDWKRKTAKSALIGAAFLSLQACTTLPDNQQINVAQAYSSSGTVAVTPYNRSIISSNNF